MSKRAVEVIINGVDNASAKIRQVSRALDSLKQTAVMRKISSSFQQVGTSIANVQSHAANLAVGFGALAAVGGLALKGMTATASKFERFSTILETVEGSSAKAQKAFEWVSNFATSTPYELDEVTDAFVRLRAYGMDPTQGLLRSLGDTSSAMGKPLMSAVEAIADAVTGENERLKEFGIKAFKKGGEITYEYTDKLGKTVRAKVNASNREAIQSTLMAIWNAKYAGAMNKQSKTLVGIFSNISDMWTRFQSMVMDSGVFEFIKGEMGSLLDKINAMAKSGELKAIAQTAGKEIIVILKDLKGLFIDLMPLAQGFGQAVSATANAVGGYANLLKILAAIAALPLLVSIGQFLFSLGSLVSTIWGAISAGSLLYEMWFAWAVILEALSGPVGWIIGAITLIAGLGALLIANWSSVSAWFQNFWAEWGGLIRAVVPIVGLIVDAGDWVIQNWDAVAKRLEDIGKSIQNVFISLGNVITGIFNDLVVGPVSAFIDGLKEISKWMPNNNVFTGQKNQFRGAALGGSISLGAPAKTTATQPSRLTAYVPPKQDRLDVAMTFNVQNGRLAINQAKSKGPSNINFNADMGMLTS
jgi:hypothetical protein